MFGKKQISLAARHHSSAGFTLVELLVVIVLTSILITVASGLLFSSLIGNSRRNVISSIKNEGDYSLSQMEFLLRNAIELVPDPANPSAPICQTGMKRISFRLNDGNTTTLYNSGNRIASQSATTGQIVYLTSPSVTLTSSDPTFDCSQSLTSFSRSYGAYVKVSFTLQKAAADFLTTVPVVDTFTTSVDMRSN